MSISYVKIAFGNRKDSQIVKNHLKGKWIEDKQIKVRSTEDTNLEKFDLRTLVFQGIPDNFNEKHISQYFSTYGTIVGIEIPKFDSHIKNLITKGVTG